MSRLISDEVSSGNELVPHSSRRRQASGDPTPDLNSNQSSSTSGGWRPVRLQGYSEDPMKDKVIKGQTETIKLLQSQEEITDKMQLRDLQVDQSRQSAADQRAREAEDALRREQARVAKQDELIEQLGNQLKALQAWKEEQVNGEDNTRRSESVEALGRHPTFQASMRPGTQPDSQTVNPSTRGSVQEDSFMILEQDVEELEEAVMSDEGPVHGGILHPKDVGPNKGKGRAEHVPKMAASAPLPLSFKRVRHQHRQGKDAPPPVVPVIPPVWTNDAASASSMPLENPMAALEAKVDLIMNNLGISRENMPPSHPQHGHRLSAREFKPPRPRAPKAQGRNERLTWVRHQLQNLLGIRQDRDILNFRANLYAQDTPLKHQMALFEKDVGGPGPSTLQPMHVNWDVVYGKWNEHIFALFLDHCRENNYGNGQLSEEDEDEINGIFFNRLERIQGVINEYRPKPGETIEQADKRYSSRHLIRLSAARRNRRRGELFNTRCSINLDHFPEDMMDLDDSDEETKRWIDRYKINEAFGIEGASSDETDPYNSDVYCVHALKWRNKKLANKLRSIDAARRTTNDYGNSRPGNRPRTRKRRPGNESKESTRKAPAGLPINCYEETWYNSLSPKKKRELQAKPALELSSAWISD